MIPLFVLILAFFSPQVRDTFFVLHWREQGRQEAERDIAAGAMKMKFWGHILPFQKDFEIEAQRLRERFGVEAVYIGDGFFPEPLDQAESYNKRIDQELDRRHGPGWWSALSREEREPGGEDRSHKRLA